MDQLPEDSELVERLRRGEIKAFDQVYQKYASKLYAFSYKYLKVSEEAEELVQNTFLKLWENQKNLKKGTSFKSYLFTIAYNEICNLFRRKKYQQKYANAVVTKSTLGTLDTEEQIEYSFVKEQVDEIISRLPERQRTIFLKSRQEGKTTKEIAQELGLSSGTVDNYLSDALKFIKGNLTDKPIPVVLFISLFFI